MAILLLTMSLLVTADANDQQEDRANREALLKTFRDEFIAITPGKGRYPKSFEMGAREGDPKSAEPKHKVTFGYDFHVAKYEVPQDLWEAVMGKNPSRWKGPRNSVELLSFDEAQTFCKKASKLMRDAKLIEADEVVRLPSEAEWEYVARAGTNSRFSFGDDLKKLDDYGWHTGNASGNDPPVGAKPNPWGLYDVHGYLWEWCLDAAHDDYQGAPADGSAWLEGGDAKRRVIRGGSWKDQPPYLSCGRRDCDFRAIKGGRLTFAGGIPRGTLDDALGLRCVLAKSKQ